MAAPGSPRGAPAKAKEVGPLVIGPDDPAVLKHGILIKQGTSPTEMCIVQWSICVVVLRDDWS